MSFSKFNNQQKSLFGVEIKSFINMDHRLVLLAKKINWSVVEAPIEAKLCKTNGRPALSMRLISGLFLLKNLDNLSDEGLVEKFIENPYYQHFCGLRDFTHLLPCNPTSLVKWRKKLGPKYFETLFAESIAVALREKVI